MRAISLIIIILLTACSGAKETAEQAAPLPPAPKRELSKAEKDRLRASLAQTLPSPSSAQFKWVPVVLRERDGGVDYCGLVNAKNAKGAQVGFTPFYAQLRKGPTGVFDGGEIKLLANPEDPGAIVATQKACRQNGYPDITDAK